MAHWHTQKSSGWGGRRKGAGRPRKPPLLVADLPQTDSPRAWLGGVMAHPDVPMRLRVEVAKALLRAAEA